MQKLVAGHSDKLENLESKTRQAAKKEDVVEMKKTMFKPLQEKQDQMDDRLKRLERGGLVTPGGGGGGSSGGEGGGPVMAGGGEIKLNQNHSGNEFG